MRMSYFFQNCNFSINSIDVRLIFYFVFLKNLDCDFIASNSMSSLLDFSKSSFTLGFTYDETANMLTLCIFFLLMNCAFSF